MKQIQDLLSKQMTRQEFVKTITLAVVSLFGVGNLISLIVKSHQSNSAKANQDISNMRGFGSRRFGA